MTQPPILPITGTATPLGYHDLHPDDSINYQWNRWAQWIGASALDSLRGLRNAGSDYPALIDGLLAMASDHRAHGDALAAAYFDRAAEFFMDFDDPRAAGTRERFVDGLRHAYGARVEPVPFEAASLPAYDLKPAESRGAPIVVFGGFDSCIEEFFPLLHAFVAAGRRIIAFDGPGQGGALADSGIPMTPDWAAPVRAVLDHFAVHEATAIGISLGGALAIRAAAHEPRIARVVAYDVCDDQLDTATRRLGPAAPLLRALLRTRASAIVDAATHRAMARSPYLSWAVRQGMRVTGATSPYLFLVAAARMRTADCAPLVRADVLLLAGADDHLIPPYMLPRQAATLRAARSVTTRMFTATEAASQHCQVGNMGLAARVIDDWITQAEDSASGLAAAAEAD